MSSPAQLTANQLNSKLSTGPVTPAGKQNSARNNLRHGFRSQTLLLPRATSPNKASSAKWPTPNGASAASASTTNPPTRHIATLAQRHPEAHPLGLQSMAIESLAERKTSHATWLRYDTKFERQYQTPSATGAPIGRF